MSVFFCWVFFSRNRFFLVAVDALRVLVAEIQAACPVVGGGGGAEEEGAALDASLRGVPVPTAQGIICKKRIIVEKSARQDEKRKE